LIWYARWYLGMSTNYEASHLQLSSFSCYFVPVRSKYSHHRILRYPPSMLFPLCERPSFTPLQDNHQNYIFVYFNLYVPRQQAGRQMTEPNGGKHSLNLICS
jgi:hypothetical protein